MISIGDLKRKSPIKLYLVGFFSAALIRGNRNNCTQFSSNLDWLISKLDRLESSSGEAHFFQCELTINIPCTAVLHYKCQSSVP